MLTPIEFEACPQWHEIQERDSAEPGADQSPSIPGTVQKCLFDHLQLPVRRSRNLLTVSRLLMIFLVLVGGLVEVGEFGADLVGVGVVEVGEDV